jgi:translation initiation factor IF-1
MSKVIRDRMEMHGEILESHRGGFFDVRTENGGNVYASICGKMRKAFIKVVPGDEVVIELSPYDVNKGRIIRRVKGGV